AAALTISLAACSGSKSSSTAPYGTGDPSLGAANPMGGPVDPFLTDGQAVTNAIDAVAARAGQPLRIMMINASAAGGLTIDIRDPHKRGNLNRYQVAPTGTVFGPIPMQLISEGRPVTAEEIDRQAFDPKAVNFARLAQAERDALTQAKIPDARVVVWSMAGIRPNDHRSIILEYSGGRVAVILDPQLNIVRLQRYGR
ncbi:MAG: hypothetical protein JOY69_09935, partial [Candidatus Eremiobacteraeota bacterium]|nr:hypothetical protein [Candidatus Eremiobacteraeota bacterium]